MIKELQEKRDSLQNELNKANRLKTVAIITDNAEEVREADCKRESLILLIEEVDKKIKIIKEEIKERIKDAQGELIDVLANQLKIEDTLKELKSQYIETGDKKLLIDIEVSNSSRKNLVKREKELQQIIDNTVLDDESKEESLEEVKVNEVDQFVSEEIDNGKSFNQIAEELNEMSPSPIDEYVLSSEFNDIYDLFVKFHYTHNGVVSCGMYKPVLDLGDSVSVSDNLDYRINDYVNKINELIPKAKDLLEKENSVDVNLEPEKYIEYRDEYASVISQVRELEASCVDAMCDILKEKYFKLIGDRIVDEKGRDYSDWVDYRAANSLHEVAVNAMLNQFINNSNAKVFSKEELNDVGKIGMITAEDVASYIASTKGEDEIERMFVPEPRVEEVKDSYQM